MKGFSKGSLTSNEVEIAANLLKLMCEGASFKNIYANSFRTDRGLFTVIDGFPALPTTSVMKYPDKMVTFPSLINAIKEERYETSFLYRGDANFTNMRSFFATGGCDEFITDVEFLQWQTIVISLYTIVMLTQPQLLKVMKTNNFYNRAKPYCKSCMIGLNKGI